MDKSEKLIIFIVLGVLVLCLCILLACGGSFLLFSNFPDSDLNSRVEDEFPTLLPSAVVDIPTMEPVVSDFNSDETLDVLESEEIPIADLNILAGKFLGKENIPIQLTSLAPVYMVGDRLDFFKLNVDSNVNTPLTATLRYATDTVYFWVEDGIDIDKADLKILVEKFANEIYPTNQEFFGKEWLPGVDNDSHLYILYAKDLGTQLAGYTSGADSVLPLVHEYSNAHEMFAINSDVQTLTDPYTLSVMAHELQHQIHGFHDSNEDLWLNEGFSELAVLLNGYDTGGFDTYFSFDPDLQLNDWSTESSENTAHYGASFLYTAYILDRFGEKITKQIVADPLNGFASIDHVMQVNNLVDTTSGQSITADNLFVDWTITNFLRDGSLGDGRYQYSIYPSAPQVGVTETIYSCDGEIQNRDVRQYGTDYIMISCGDKNISFHFSGDPEVPVLPFSVESGKFMWSNRADSSWTSLTREFDFTDAAAPISVSYLTWYDLEEDYDFLYLLASEDGSSQQILSTPSCTTYDPSGNSYGCGYNGNSLGWVQEEVDLSQFAGKKISLSFEYVTDEAVTGEGLILDDIEIPALNYRCDFEDDDCGWEANGFVRIRNSIPQTFLVTVISSLGTVPVWKYQVNSGESLEVSLDVLSNGENYIVLVSGSSRFTRQKAGYQFQAIPK